METLYFRPQCPFCIKVLEHISKLNIPIELKNTEDNSEFDDELLANSGRSTVPCLKTEKGDFVFEADKIIRYLNRNYVLASHPMRMKESQIAEYTDKLDSLAEDTGLNSILIMASMEDKMYVLITNENKHYHRGDAGEKSHVSKHKKPLYCEKVVKTGKSLYVADASVDPEWSENEDLELFGLGVYLGLPVKKEGTVVGTVCALHNQPFDFKSGIPSAYQRLETIKNKLEVLI